MRLLYNWRMMNTAPRYLAHAPDEKGYIPYTDAEHLVWNTLYQRQVKIIENRACDVYYDGVLKLDLNHHKIPQCKDVTEILQSYTGWSVTPVGALISFKDFFDLIANKTFPAASFIRRMEDLDYLPEPDIFHEIFGHCPLLTDPAFAAFTEEIGRFGQTILPEDRKMLARLYWFTVEFGLLEKTEGLKIYGAGILSSKREISYALESPLPLRKPFDLLEVLRTPYRYDQLQKNYFIISSFDELYNLVKGNLVETFKEAKRLGMLPDPFDDLPLDPEDVRSC
jgi:phenylalanine-4-hydroxylase